MHSVQTAHIKVYCSCFRCTCHRSFVYQYFISLVEDCNMSDGKSIIYELAWITYTTMSFNILICEHENNVLN